MSSIADFPKSADRRAENLNAELLDLAFEPIFVRRLDGTITYWNKGAAELYGYSKEEAEGASCHALLKTVSPISQEEFQEALLKEGRWIGQLSQITKTGRKLIVESRHQLFVQADGQPLILETIRDITERETQYRMIYEGMQEGVSVCLMLYDEKGQPNDWIYLDANPALEKIHGIEGLAGMRGSEVFPNLKESCPELLGMYGRVAMSGIPEQFEGYLEALGRWIFVSAFSPMKHHIITIGRDITQRKHIEEALARSRDQLKSFVEQMPAAVAMLDKELRYVAFSQRWLDDYGLGKQDLTGRHHYDVFPEIRHMKGWQAIHQRALAGAVERCEEERFVRSDGSEFWLRWEVKPWHDGAGEIGGMVMYTEDISERKRTEFELRLTKERLDHLVSSSPVVTYSCQASGDFGATYVSANVTQLMGYAPQDFTSDSGFWAGHIHPDDRTRVLSELPELLESDSYTHEYRFLQKDGSYRWMHDELRLIRDPQGDPQEIIGAWRDITEQKLVQDELFEREQRLRLAMDSADMGAWEWNLNTDEIWLDDRQFKLFGIPKLGSSVCGTDMVQLIHLEDRERVKAAIERTVSQGEVIREEFRVVHPDGSVHWLAGLGQMLSDASNGTRRMIGVNFDVTERVRGEEARDKYTRLENLAQMHRMHVAGEFAALLAHQLNQPLTAIRSFAEAGLARLRRGKFEPLEMRETLEDVVAQSDRAAGSIRDLRKFLARQPQEKSVGDLNAEVRAACTLMEVLARGRNIRFKLNLEEALPLVFMRPSQIEQVIINLMENAMDAISLFSKNGGVIEIRTKFDPAQKEVVAELLDSGPGLDSDAVTRVFEPLYTTKKNGIGMGLVISRSVIQDHGGRIWAEPGTRGRFIITLPVPQ